MSSAATGLSVEKIHVWRGDRHVLRGVSFDLPLRSALHVVGPNGAGKTTLLRVVTGLMRPEQGQVTWCGRSIATGRIEYQRELAYASHEPALKSDLSALENLAFAVGLKRRVSSSELQVQLQRTGVADCADLPARVLSAGQRRRVAMAGILAVRAALWVLDEPFTNLDAAGSALVGELLAEHVTQGGSALIVAHHDLQLAAPLERLELRS